MYPAAYYQHRSPTSQRCCLEGNQGTKWAMALAPLCLPASWTLCIYFLPPPKSGTRYHFLKARLGARKLCVARVLNIVSLWCWALFKCCLLCVLTSVNCLLSISFQAGGFFILLQIPPTFIWNSCQWDVSGVRNSRTQELAENAMRIWRGYSGWDNGKWCFMDEVGKA